MLDKLLKSDYLKQMIVGFLVSFGISIGYFLLYLTTPIKKAIFGFFYFLCTPIMALPSFPVSLLVMMIFLLLFRRVNSCMRIGLRWVAYALLWLHWVAFGMYCSSYVVI